MCVAFDFMDGGIMVGVLYNIYDDNYACDDNFYRAVVLDGWVSGVVEEKYMLFILSMNINMFVVSVLACPMAGGSA